MPGFPSLKSPPWFHHIFMGFPETQTKAFSPSYLSCLFYSLPFTSTPFCYLLSVFLVFYPSTNGKMYVCRGRCCCEGKTVSCVTSAQLPAFKMLLLSVQHMNHWRPAWEKLPLIRRIKPTRIHTCIKDTLATVSLWTGKDFPALSGFCIR